MTYRVTRPSYSQQRFRPNPLAFNPRLGLLDLGIQRFTQPVPGYASFGFGCGCHVSVNPTGEHRTTILSGCHMGHPLAWHGVHK